MNIGLYIFARALAVLFIAFLLIGIESAGLGWRERRDIPSYQRLGEAVSDPGTAHVDRWWSPPQLQLSGRYHGVRYHYEIANRRASHLLVDCRPRAGWDVRRGSSETLDRVFPGWIALYASPGPVPWTKRSLNRRPLGFGAAPGIDLYYQTGNSFDPRMVQSNLQNLEAFCSKTATGIE